WHRAWAARRPRTGRSPARWAWSRPRISSTRPRRRYSAEGAPARLARRAGSAEADEEADGEDGDHPEDRHHHRHPGEAALDHNGAREAGLDTAAEDRGQAAALAAEQQDEQQQQPA